MTNTKQTPLSKAKQVLDADFTTHHIPSDDSTPFESLYIALGKDDQNRDLVISLNFVNDITNSLGMNDEVDDAYFLQFFLLFPFQVPQEKMEEVALAALKLSRILPAGALGIVEETGAFFYQYNLGCATREVDPAVLTEVVNIMSFFGVEFGSKIEQIATGKKSRTDIFKELKDNGVDFPPISPPSS